MMLTNNQKEIALENIRKGMFASHTLKERIEKGTLEEDMKNTLLSAMEYYMLDVQKELDFESHLKEEHDSRFAEIRNANIQIQELKNQLASKNPLDGFQEQFNLIRSTINDWWKQEGFAYVESVEAVHYGLKVNFGFQLEMRSSMFSQDREGDKAKDARHKEALKDKGFVFADNLEDSFYRHLLYDTPENKELLASLILEGFPSFEVKEFLTFNHLEFTSIRSVCGIIREVGDVQRLT